MEGAVTDQGRHQDTQGQHRQQQGWCQPEEVFQDFSNPSTMFEKIPKVVIQVLDVEKSKDEARGEGEGL